MKLVTVDLSPKEMKSRGFLGQKLQGKSYILRVQI
jgi:hypothetical protein